MTFEVIEWQMFILCIFIFNLFHLLNYVLKTGRRGINYIGGQVNLVNIWFNLTVSTAWWNKPTLYVF